VHLFCATGLVTIVFFWITVASMIWLEKIVKGLFVIPIASLFAFTSVRSNMPGAPPGFSKLLYIATSSAVHSFPLVFLFVVGAIVSRSMELQTSSNIILNPSDIQNNIHIQPPFITCN
jgi:hypothetical protein